MKAHLLQVLNAIAAFFLLAFGLTSIGLGGNVNVIINGYDTKGTMWPQDFNSSQYARHIIWDLPSDLRRGSNSAVIVAGIFSTLAGMDGLLLIAIFRGRDWTSARRAMFVALGFALVSFSTMIISFVALCFAMVTQHKASTFQYTDADSSGQHFTIESWTCQLKNELATEHHWMAKVCREAKAARFMTIPLFILSIAAIWPAVLYARDRQARARECADPNYQETSEKRSSGIGLPQALQTTAPVVTE